MVDDKTDIMKDPHRTMFHQVVRWDPFQWINERWSGPGTGRMHQHISVRLFSSRFIKPVIEYIDNAVRDTGLIKPIKALDGELLKIRFEMVTAPDDEKDKLWEKSDELVYKFCADYADNFRELEEKLVPLRNEINAHPLIDEEAKETRKYSDGMANIDDEQKEAMLKMINHLIRLTREAQDPEKLVKSYQKNRSMFEKVARANDSLDIEKEAAGISGGFQQYTELAASADLRITMRGKYRWKPRRQKGFPWVNIYGTPLIGEPDTFRRITHDNDGADGILAGTHGRYQQNLQNRDRLLRSLKDGHYNTHIRTADVVNGGGKPDNAENYGLVIEKLWQENSTIEDGTPKLNIREEDYAVKAAELVEEGYDAGREGDVLNSYRRLVWQQGPSGSVRTYPQYLIAQLRQRERRKNDPHFQAFVTSLERLQPMDHNHYPFNQRHVNQIMQKLTWPFQQALIAPHQEYIGTPGKAVFVRDWFSHLVEGSKASFLGGHLIPNLDEHGVAKPEKPIRATWYWFPRKSGGVDGAPVRLRDTIWLKLPWNYATMLFWLPKNIIKTIGIPLKPVAKHTSRGLAIPGIVALAGVAASAAQKGLEYRNDTSYSIDLGRHITNIALKPYNWVLAPPRWIAAGGTLIINKITGGALEDTWITNPDRPRILSTDFLVVANNLVFDNDVRNLGDFPNIGQFFAGNNSNLSPEFLQYSQNGMPAAGAPRIDFDPGPGPTLGADFMNSSDADNSIDRDDSSFEERMEAYRQRKAEITGDQPEPAGPEG